MTALIRIVERYFMALCIVAYVLERALEAAVFGQWTPIVRFRAVEWFITHYHVDYFQFGFAKRALIATLISPILALMEDGGVGERMFISTLDFVLFVLLIWMIHRFLRSFPESARSWVTGLRALIILSPIGVMQWACDTWRFDHANMVLIALALWAAMRSRYILVGVFMGIGALVHEGIVVFGVPTLFAYALAHQERPATFVKIAILPAIVAILVIFYGNVDQAVMAEKLGPDIAGSADVWARGIWWGVRPMGLLDSVILGVYLLATYLLLGTVRVKAKLWPLVYLMTFAPLTLYVLGSDYYRWVQICFACVGFSLVPLVREGLAHPRLPSWPSRMAFLWLFVPLGPLGVVHAFPYIQRALGTL